jgi:small subunit ribosomal protein S24e
MELKIVEESTNILLGRKDVRFHILHPGIATPKRLEVKEILASKLGRKPEEIFIIRYKTKTGTQVSEGLCHIYDSKELARLLLPKHVFLKNLPIEEREALKAREEEERKEKEKEKEKGEPSSKEGGKSPKK